MTKQPILTSTNSPLAVIILDPGRDITCYVYRKQHKIKIIQKLKTNKKRKS